jgi:hypothetical protein
MSLNFSLESVTRQRLAEGGVVKPILISVKQNELLSPE